MLSLSSPLWLMGLATLPLVWWLHRFHDLDRSHQVAALFLWSAQDAPGSQLRRSRRTDPVWLLRALTTGLLVLALCGPGWNGHGAGDLHIWVDDSPSLFALDQGVSRMTQVLPQLERQLQRSRFSSITAHSLAAPRKSLRLGKTVSSAAGGELLAWAATTRGEPEPPVPALMDAGATHWLLSDGASSGIDSWVQQAPLSRIFNPGGDSANVGITMLALRRGEDGIGRDRILVSVANGGLEDATRELEISLDGQRLPPVTLRIPTGALEHEVIEVPRTRAGTVSARIRPGDALPLDDRLELSTAGLQPATVAVSDGCGMHLRAALASHPALVLAGNVASSTDLRVTCGDDGATQVGPALRTGREPGSITVTGPMHWLPAAGPLRELSLDPAWLAVHPVESAAGDAAVLLRAANGPLILFDSAARIIDVRLDLAGPNLVQRPEYPLLIAGLADLLLADTPGRGRFASVANHAQVAIAPRVLEVNSGRPAADSNTVDRDLTGILIVAALLSLIVDPALRGRRLARRPGKPGSAMESA